MPSSPSSPPPPPPPSPSSTSPQSRPRSPITHRRARARAQLPLHKRNPALHLRLTHLSTHLSPLISLTTGETHPSFPQTLLSFWLLTSAQLNDLAHHYHQHSPGPYSAHYPCPVYGSWDTGASLDDKRRRLGRFIGLRGCESPVAGVVVEEEGGEQRDGDQEGAETVQGSGEVQVQTTEEIERLVRAERERRAEWEGFVGRKGRWC